MINSSEAYILLRRSFDEQLSSAEQSALKMALENQADLRLEKERWEKLHYSFANVDGPSLPFFSGKVMHQIEQLKNKAETTFEMVLERVFPKIAIPSLTLIAVFMISIYWTEGNFSVDSLLGLSELSETAFTDIDFETYNW